MIDFKWLSNLPSQQEIMDQWDGSYKGQPQVSIVCITYNQEGYIKDALNGFLQQKTKFPFEIIVHDDVSTDSTREILKSYRDKYPEIIKLILQKENQFSKSMYLPLKNCFDFVASSSKYIALCEGDDFWVVADKIQSQYNALEDKKNTDICFTTAYKLYNSGKAVSSYEYGSKPIAFTRSEVVIGGGGFMPTASIFLRKRVVNKIPEWFLKAPVIDFYLQSVASSQGGALYLPVKSCVYRVSSQGSWTESNKYLSSDQISTTLERSLAATEGLFAFDISFDDIARSKASSYCHAAHVFLIGGYYKESRRAIGESWRLGPNLNKIQRYIYLSRFFLPLARLGFYLKRI